MTSLGTKNIKITKMNQQMTFIIQPPWCIPSRGSFWVFTPIIITDKIEKNTKFPKLTRSTASVSNHSRSGVLWKWLIPTQKMPIIHKLKGYNDKRNRKEREKLTRELLHERSSDLTENPWNDQRKCKEATVSNPCGTSADTRNNSTASIACTSSTARC